MAKGKVVAKTGIKRKSGHLYFVDANGNVRETKMQRGAKKGHRTCSAAKKRAAKKRPASKKRAVSRKRKTRR